MSKLEIVTFLNSASEIVYYISIILIE